MLFYNCYTGPIPHCIHSFPLSLHSMYSWCFPEKCLPCVMNLLYYHSSPLKTWTWSSSFLTVWVMATAEDCRSDSAAREHHHQLALPESPVLSHPLRRNPICQIHSHSQPGPTSSWYFYFFIAPQLWSSVLILGPALTLFKHTMLLLPSFLIPAI